MRTATIIFVTLSILYIIGGGTAVLIGKLDSQFYFNSFAITAGLASILGLIAFVIPKLSKKDVEDVGIEYFKNVVEASEELKKRENELTTKEQALSSKERELKELEIKKQEMELLVRQMSMNLFLRDQYERQENKIKELIDKDSDLKKSLAGLTDLKTKLTALEQEIESDPNVDLLKDIIDQSSSNGKPKDYNSILEILSSGVIQSLFRILR